MLGNAGPIPARTTVDRRCLDNRGSETFLRAQDRDCLANNDANRELRQVLEVVHAAATCMLSNVGVIAAMT